MSQLTPAKTSDNFDIKAFTVCLVIAIPTGILYFLNHRSKFQTIDALLVVLLAIMGGLLASFSHVDKIDPSGDAGVLLKSRIKRWLGRIGVTMAICALLLEVKSFQETLETARQPAQSVLDSAANVIANTSPEMTPVLTRQLKEDFDSVACTEMAHLAPDDASDFDYRRLSDRLEDLRSVDIERVMDVRQVDLRLRPLYKRKILDTLHTDTLAVVCDGLDSLREVADDANAVIQQRDMQEVHSFVVRHRLSPDARILRPVGRDLVRVGSVEGAIKDFIQYALGYQLRAVRSMDEKGHFIIDLVIITQNQRS